jgi:pimeloyl-ACP methyl ester carboxylesterase
MKRIAGAVIGILIVIMLITVGVLFLRPCLIISKAEAKKELALPSSHFINWRGAELHYTDEGSGYPVLMMHGFGGSVRNFSKLANNLKGQFRVVRVDLPGFGLSDFPDMGSKPNYIKMYSDYLTFILDTLHLDSVYIIGNSMGGGMAWLTAAQHPDKVKKLVLLSSAGYDVANVSGKLVMFKYKSVGHIFDKGMPVFMSESGLKACYAQPEKADSAVWVLNNHFTNREGNIKNMLALARSHQFPDSSVIAKVQCPTLIIWGKQDAVIPVSHAERFHRDIKNSRVIIYDPCGHVSMLERSDDVTRDFLQFVKE